MILNVKKPKGMTSHDVVDRVRQITKEKRVGHAGTLDPFATGVLIIATKREDTKKLGDIAKSTKKEYVAILELGKISTTGDPEGIITSFKNTLTKLSYPHLDLVKDVLNSFIGEIMQTPPSYSAIKVNGVPAYKLARKGQAIKLSSRKVIIEELNLLTYNPPFLKIQVICGSGTYIRSLAKDIGEKLNTGAYLIELERTRVGNFKIEDSIPLAKLALVKL